MPAKTASRAQTQPRYQRLTDEMRRQVQQGVLRPGDRLPSISELRASHGFSKSTIERAHVLLEQEGLVVREHGRGTFVTQPKAQRTGVIGFCSGGFTQTFSPFWIHLMEGIEQAARDSNVQIQLLRDDAAIGWDKVNGVLVNGTWPKIPARCIAPDLPFVSLFAPAQIIGSQAECERVRSSMTTIGVDYYTGMRQATEHLLALGHKRIAYLNNGVNDTRIYPHRLAGYHDALREAGLRFNAKWLCCMSKPGLALYFMPVGRQTMKAWIEDDWKTLGCTALLAHNDEVAWGAVEALREAGVRVPEDVSVVGYDGTEVADCCTPALTTVKIPLQRIGAKGVEILQKRIEGQSCEPEITIPTKLRVAGSTARV